MIYILWTIFIIGASSLFISVKFPDKEEVDKVIVLFLVTVTVHAFYVTVVEIFSLPRYIDTAFPFGLLYGPIFFFAIRVLTGESIRRRMVMIHMAPFFFWVILYFVFCFSTTFRLEYYKLYHTALYSMISLSMITYVATSLYRNRKLNVHEDSHKTIRLITTGVALLATVGLFVFTINFRDVIPSPTPRQFSRMFIYSAMLLQVVAVFRFQVLRLIQRTTRMETDHLVVTQKNDQANKIEKKVGLYEKSLVPDSILNLYENKLKDLERTKMYRDMNLSLGKLAKKIDAPKHHLTQLLNIRMSTSFNKYINGLRIEYACELLKEERKLSMEELAYECGFNSKVSFYRNFKNVTGVTPSEYRKTLKADPQHDE